ncbi:MAG: TlpA family protein disulfide reductase [Flavobacterium sp.]|nr:MAG: TlpA family protein disulfide reductase [Flavobacterium sp.]
MRTLTILITLCLFVCSVYPQQSSNKEYKLTVNLQNAPFSSLAVLDYRDSHNAIIRGKSIGQFKWEITIPDSIVANSEFMMLIVPDKDTIANAYHQLRFNSDFKGIKSAIVNIGIQDENNYIEANYKNSTLYKDEYVASFMGITDSVIKGNLITDDFNVTIKDDSSDITVRSLDPYYAWFGRGDNPDFSYEEHVQSYIKLARMYPQSRYLMTYLTLNLRDFKSKQDISNIYKNFSKERKKSKSGKKVEHFLSEDFNTIMLTSRKSGRSEPLIQSSSKYNLVIFSASWCGPCIKEIPLLKKLYKKYGGHINFTYVSVDVEKGIKAFEKVLIENGITTWRTLYAYKNLDELLHLYSIQSIPHSILFYPNGQMEVVDVRDEAWQQKLSSLK